MQREERRPLEGARLRGRRSERVSSLGDRSCYPATPTRHRALRLFVSGVFAYFLLATACCTGQNSAVHVSQLSHTAWRLRDGALPGMPTVVTQTKDGYIWLGTPLGLYRFDGQRFARVPLPSGRFGEVLALLADRDGSLWIGTYGSLFHETGGQIKEVVHGLKLEQLMQNASGEIWAATAFNEGRPACVLRSGKFECLEHSPLQSATTIGEDDQGGIWFAHPEAVERRERGVVVPPTAAEKSLVRNVNLLCGHGAGVLWAATHATGKLPTLLSRAGGIWRAGPALPGLTKSTNIQTILVDREGATWVGTSDQGLYRVNGSQIDRFNRADGLSSDDVRDIHQDAEGSVWVATSAGLDQFHRSLVDTWSTREGLTADSVSSILADHRGRIWMGNEGGLDVLENGQIHSYRPGSGLPGQTVAGLAEDHLGRIWVGVDKDLYLFDGTTFQKLLAPGGKPVGLIVMMREDLKGRMWVRSHHEFFLFTQAGVEKVAWKYGDQLTAMEPDSKGGMWMGARGLPPVHVPADSDTVISSAKQEGSMRFNGFLQVEGDIIAARAAGFFTIRNGTTYTLDQHNGLIFDQVLKPVRSNNGDIFVGTETGYLEITKQEFDRWLQDPTAKIQSRLIDTSDGALPGVATFTPNSLVAPNGDLWFATDRFPQRIDPKQLGVRHNPPNIVFETLTADGRTINSTGLNRLPAGTQNIDITYAALSFLHPQQIQYRYRLQGFDKDWQAAGTRREAIYTNLPPGSYTFQVCASDKAGGWTTSSVAFQFSVAPHFYQRLWFRLLVGFLVISLLWAAYLSRVRYLSREANARFFERLSERERIARDLHDTFFQGIQGILLRFQTGTSALPSDEPIRPMFEAILKQSDQVMLEGRELVLDLRERASENRDLEQAFGTVCEELTRMFPIPYQIIRQGQAKPIVPDVRKELFFIGREALMNAFQHSQAKNIEVELSFHNRTVGLRIRDDGNGMDADVQRLGSRRGHFGLTGMQERAKMAGATLKVWSQAGAGTEVDIQVPIAVALGLRDTPWNWLARLTDTQA